MFFEFFINACILISFISISYLFFKDKDVNNDSSFTLKIIIGLASGGLGIILILYGVQVNSNIIIDFRYTPILLTAFYFGFLPAIVSAISIGAFRVLYFGISETSIIALIISILVGLGFSIICSLKLSRKNKWIFSTVYLFFLFPIALHVVLKDKISFYKILVTYFIGNVSVSWVIFIYTEHLYRTIILNKQLKDEATKDFLTGLNNVRQFDTSFNSISQLALRKKENLSLLFLDIDYFKKVNDTYGHNKGDIVLKNLAEILNDTVRVFDVVSRNGGEEFSILLLDCSSTHAIDIAERLRKKVEMHNFKISEKENLKITISIGISTYPSTTDNIDNLLNDSDKALYEAKRTGRNKVILYKKQKSS